MKTVLKSIPALLLAVALLLSVGTAAFADGGAVLFDKQAGVTPVILLAGGHEKGLPVDPLKPYLSGVKALIGYGECGPRLIDELTDGQGILVKDLPEALARAQAIAAPGDVVLLSPTTSSYDQYTCFEERGEHFKALVNAL